MPKATVSVLIVAASLLPAAAEAQEPRPTYRVGSELVVVDLVATDRSGKSVGDLKPTEIQLLENGKAQKIQFVTIVRGGRTSTTEAPSAGAAIAPAPAPGDSAPAVRDAELFVAIVLDLVSMPPDALTQVRDAIQRMVRDELPPETATMLATIDQGISIKQTVTKDRAAVLRSLDGLPLPLSAHLSLTEMLEKTDQACDANPAGGGGGLSIQSVISQGVTLGKALIAENRQRLTTATEALSALSRSLASAPGRKHVVLFSAGYLLNPIDDVIDAITASVAGCRGSDPGSPNVRQEISQELASMKAVDSTAQLQAAIDRANRGQVSFYAVDPRGLVTTNLQAQHTGSARLARRGVIQKVAALDQTASHGYLQSVAAGTGGIAFLNTNDLTRGLRRAWLDASEYYLIGYAPSGSRRKGQFQKIEVKVARPDIDVRYRRGYYDATEQELAQRDLEGALRNPSSFSQEGFAVETSMEGGKLWVITLIPPAAIRFASDGTVHKAAFSVHATLRDAQGKLVGGKPAIGRDLGVSLKPDRLAELLSSGSNVEVRTDLNPPSPGTYQLTVVVRDSGGWMAARAVEVSVPRSR